MCATPPWPGWRIWSALSADVGPASVAPEIGPGVLLGMAAMG